MAYIRKQGKAIIKICLRLPYIKMFAAELFPTTKGNADTLTAGNLRRSLENDPADGMLY